MQTLRHASVIEKNPCFEVTSDSQAVGLYLTHFTSAESSVISQKTVEVRTPHGDISRYVKSDTAAQKLHILDLAGYK